MLFYFYVHLLQIFKFQLSILSNADMLNFNRFKPLMIAKMCDVDFKVHYHY